MKSHYHKGKRCSCGNVIDVASSADPEPPRKKDLSICMYCGQVHQFNADLELVEIDLDQLPDYARAEINSVQNQIKQMNRVLPN
jgi:molybdopterin synthase catalytic subunit